MDRPWEPLVPCVHAGPLLACALAQVGVVQASSHGGVEEPSATCSHAPLLACRPASSPGGGGPHREQRPAQDPQRPRRSSIRRCCSSTALPAWTAPAGRRVPGRGRRRSTFSDDEPGGARPIHERWPPPALPRDPAQEARVTLEGLFLMHARLRLEQPSAPRCAGGRPRGPHPRGVPPGPRVLDDYDPRPGQPEAVALRLCVPRRLAIPPPGPPALRGRKASPTSPATPRPRPTRSLRRTTTAGWCSPPSTPSISIGARCSCSSRSTACRWTASRRHWASRSTRRTRGSASPATSFVPPCSGSSFDEVSHERTSRESGPLDADLAALLDHERSAPAPQEPLARVRARLALSVAAAAASADPPGEQPRGAGRSDGQRPRDAKSAARSPCRRVSRGQPRGGGDARLAATRAPRARGLRGPACAHSGRRGSRAVRGRAWHGADACSFEHRRGCPARVGRRSFPPSRAHRGPRALLPPRGAQGARQCALGAVGGRRRRPSRSSIATRPSSPRRSSPRSGRPSPFRPSSSEGAIARQAPEPRASGPRGRVASSCPQSRRASRRFPDEGRSRRPIEHGNDEPAPCNRVDGHLAGHRGHVLPGPGRGPRGRGRLGLLYPASRGRRPPRRVPEHRSAARRWRILRRCSGLLHRRRRDAPSRSPPRLTSWLL